MKLEEGIEKFYQAWGTFAGNWGINRTMAQIHAVLLVSEKPLSTEDIMQELKISRGNANMNLRMLMDWGLVSKELITGERKEHFVAEKDIWEVSKLIAKERKRRELEPVIKVLDELSAIKDNSEKGKAFKKQINEISGFAKLADNFFSKFIKSNDNWLMKLIKYMAK